MRQAPPLPLNDPLLLEAVSRIRRRFRPLRVLLFGSRAWGEPRRASDYDLVLIVQDHPDVRRLAGEVHWEIRDLDASFDVLAWTAPDWDLAAATRFTLEHRIEREGVDLLAAA